MKAHGHRAHLIESLASGNTYISKRGVPVQNVSEKRRAPGFDSLHYNLIIDNVADSAWSPMEMPCRSGTRRLSSFKGQRFGGFAHA